MGQERIHRILAWFKGQSGGSRNTLFFFMFPGDGCWWDESGTFSGLILWGCDFGAAWLNLKKLVWALLSDVLLLYYSSVETCTPPCLCYDDIRYDISLFPNMEKWCIYCGLIFWGGCVTVPCTYELGDVEAFIIDILVQNNHNQHQTEHKSNFHFAWLPQVQPSSSFCWD